MYTFDFNTNTAIERQADSVRAVKVVSLDQPNTQPTGVRNVGLAVAAAVPFVLIAAWALLLH